MYYIEQLISRTLAFYLKHGFVNTLPPDTLDIRTVTDPMVSFLDTELFIEGSEWSRELDAPDYHVLQGRLSCCQQDILFSTDSGILGLLPSHTCRYEPGILEGYVDLDKVLLLIPDASIDTNLLVVTPNTYDQAAPFGGSMYDKRFFLSEYIELPEVQRKVLYRFLRSPGAAQYCFLCMAYLSSLMIKKGNTLSPGDVPEAVESVERILPRFVGVQFVRCDLMTLLELSGFFHHSVSFHMSLALWAIFHKASVWEELGAAEALLASGLGSAPHLHAYLELVCSPAELRHLAGSIADPQLHDTEPALCDRILLQLLYTNIKLEENTISLINHHLFFHNPLELEDIRKLTPIRHSISTNWETIVDDLFSKVSTELAKDSTAYTRALALVWILEIGNWKVALSDAQEMILEGETDAAVLVGMHMLSLILWHELRSPKKNREPIVLEYAQAILQKLSVWLMEPDIHYNIAAILARDLVYWGADPAPLADHRIRETALARRAANVGNRIYPCILLSVLNDKI